MMILAQPRVTRALFIETGTYDDQYLRPYAVNVDPSSIATFSELVAHGNHNPLVNGGNCKPFQNAEFGSFATDIIRPSSSPTAAVTLPNGFNTRRYRFLIEFEVSLGAGSVVREYLTGYTDTPDAVSLGTAIGGQVDVNSNLRLYFNNLFVLNYVNINGVVTPQVTDASQVLRQPDLLSNPFSAPNTGIAPMSQVTTMLPYNIFDKLADTSRNLGQPVESDVAGFQTNPVRSHTRENNLPSGYLAKVFNGFAVTTLQNGANMESLNGSSGFNPNGGFGNALFEDAHTPFSQGTSHTMENTFIRDQVIKHLWMNTGFRINRSVSYGEMRGAFHGFDQVSEFRGRGQAMQTSAPGMHTIQSGMSASWGGSGHESVIAAMLSQAVPSLMMQNMIHTINFTVSNASGQPAFGINPNMPPMSLINGIPMEVFCERFKLRFMSELYRSLSMNGQILLNLHISCNVLGDTKIGIGFNSMTTTDFFCPTFCDSLMSPVLTNQPSALAAAAHGFDQMAQAVGLSPNVNTALNQALGTNTPMVSHTTALF